MPLIRRMLEGRHTFDPVKRSVGDVVHVRAQTEKEGHETYDIRFVTGRGFVLTESSRGDAMFEYPVTLGKSTLQYAEYQMEYAVRVVSNLLYNGNVFAYQAVYIGCYIACFLQMIILVFIAFEDPGFAHQPSGVLRYISNNIDSHRGYGTAMVMCFASSLVPLAMCRLLTLLGDFLLFFFMFVATVGGGWVIMFHDANDASVISKLHVAGAAMLILGGVMMHMCVISDLSPLRINRMRDNVLLLCTALCALGFLLTIIVVKAEGYTQDTHPEWFWASAALEYLLYVTFVALNWLVPERLLQHTALRLVVSIPQVIQRRDIWLTPDSAWPSFLKKWTTWPWMDDDFRKVV